MGNEIEDDRIDNRESGLVSLTDIMADIAKYKHKV